MLKLFLEVSSNEIRKTLDLVDEKIATDLFHNVVNLKNIQ